MSKTHLYLHVPFCKTICAYCDFCHYGYSLNNVKKWLEELKKELQTKNLSDFDTIYIGGGTPSCLEGEDLETLLALIKPYSTKTIEYTIEVNPETITEDKVKVMKAYGINRISMGLQTSNPDELKLINRHHNFEDVKRVVDLFRKYDISNISIDVMYSLPNQTMATLSQTLKDVLSLAVPHISLYSLTIEPNSLFGKKGYEHLDEDLEADMYEYIEKTLIENGYMHYEISNFAKKGYESKHNLGYWNYDDFVGVSMGASGKENGIRYDNVRSLKDYLNGKHVLEETILSKEDQMFEQIMMSLRTSFGLDLDLFNKRYALSFFEVYQEAYHKHQKDFIIKDNHLIVKNLELLNSLLVDFLD